MSASPPSAFSDYDGVILCSAEALPLFLPQQREENLASQRQREERLLSLLLDKSSSDTSALFEELCALHPQYRDISRCVVGVIQTFPFHRDHLDEPLSFEMQTLVADMNRILEGSRVRLIPPLDRDGEILLLFFCGCADAKAICLNLVEHAHREFAIELQIGLSHEMSFPGSASAAAGEARHFADTYNLLEISGGVHTMTPPESQNIPCSLVAMENRLFAALLQPSSLYLSMEIDRLCEDLLSSNFFCMQQLNRLLLSYHGMRIRWGDSIRIRYPEQDDQVQRPFFHFISSFDQHGAFSVSLLKRGFMEDISRVGRYYFAMSGQEQSDVSTANQVADYLHFSFNRHISQEEVAKLFYMSVSHLGHIFKKTFGTGMVEYVNRLRVERAKELLSPSPPRLRISDVAVSVGFSDEKYFSRVFKQYTGLSPQQYRNNLENPRGQIGSH